MGNQYSQLTLDERYQIQALNKLNHSARKIAIEISRSNKTVSQELNRCAPNKYCAKIAHHDANQQRKHAIKAHKASDQTLKEVKRLLILKKRSKAATHFKNDPRANCRAHEKRVF